MCMGVKPGNETSVQGVGRGTKCRGAHVLYSQCSGRGSSTGWRGPEGVLAGDLQEEKEDEEQGEGSASEGEEEGWKVVCRSRR